MHKDSISVIISSSPIPSHPSTRTIEETIRSIRWHLPKAPIYVMCDGVRPEQKEQYGERYLEYIHQLAGKAMFEFTNIKIVPFMEWQHQALCTVKTLELIKTPLLVFCEADTPLLERPIDWDMLKEAVTSGETNMIRFHYDEEVHADHQHLMCGKLTENLIKTVQWHQRPHLTGTHWYEQTLSPLFPSTCRCHIEDKIYGPVTVAPWEDYRLTVYDPEGTGQKMKRSTHTNGRDDDEKFGEKFD
jgi:hypothetical protein